MKPSHGTRNESQIPDYIRLGEMLQKTRSPLKQEAVDAVLRSRSSLREKIEKINHIDAADEFHAPPPADEKAGKKRPAAEPEDDRRFARTDDPGENDLRTARRNQYKLVRQQAEAGFLHFLFREYGAIRRFGARTGVLAFSFPYRIGLAREALEAAAADLERVDLRAVLAVLGEIVSHGWQVLEKFEYNCVAALAEYCRALAAVPFPALDRHDRHLIHRLKEVERLHLVLHGPPGVREAVFAALDKIVEHAPGREARARDCAERVRLLLAESESRPSIGNLLLGLNMLRWRRFFRMHDLSDRIEGELVSSAAFDCPEEVRLEINSFLERQEERLRRLAREQALIEREIEFFPLDENGEVAWRELSRFYCRQTGTDKTGTWTRDTEQILFFLARAVELYVADFRPLLCEALAFEPAGSGRAFAGPLFDSDVALLDRARTDLERHLFSYGGMARSRYQEIRGTHHTATRIEAEAFTLVTDVLSRLHIIARKLVAQLTSPEKVPAAEDPAAALPGEVVPLSHGDKVIRDQPFLSGKTVRDALRFAASIAYGIGLFLSDPALWGIIRRETPLRAEHDGVLRSLKRIAPAGAYEELERKYAIR